MENFFYDDTFYSELSDLIDALDLEDTIHDEEDNYCLTVYECDLQPLVTFTPEWILERIDEERFSEDGAENEYERMEKALKECIDFEKLNSLIPAMWYATKRKETITKADIIECINS